MPDHTTALGMMVGKQTGSVYRPWLHHWGHFDLWVVTVIGQWVC